VTAVADGKNEVLFWGQELFCFRTLAQRESAAVVGRKAEAAQRLSKQEEREQELQQRYKALTSELVDVRKAVAAVTAA
jgi:hypothetical protein